MILDPIYHMRQLDFNLTSSRAPSNAARFGAGIARALDVKNLVKPIYKPNKHASLAVRLPTMIKMRRYCLLRWWYDKFNKMATLNNFRDGNQQNKGVDSFLTLCRLFDCAETFQCQDLSISSLCRHFNKQKQMTHFSGVIRDKYIPGQPV